MSKLNSMGARRRFRGRSLGWLAGALMFQVGIGALGDNLPVVSGTGRVKGDVTGEPVMARFGLTRWGRALDPPERASGISAAAVGPA